MQIGHNNGRNRQPIIRMNKLEIYNSNKIENQRMNYIKQLRICFVSSLPPLAFAKPTNEHKTDSQAHHLI